MTRAGDLVTLEEQDRSLWDTATIEQACTILDRAVRRRRPGPYQLLAAIAACHAQAPTAADTDWREIARCYERLNELSPSPVVALNRAVAVAMDHGPAAGLALVDELERQRALPDYYLLPATRADLLRRMDRNEEAAAAYRRALELAPTDAERRYLAGGYPRSQRPPDPGAAASGGYGSRLGAMSIRGFARSSPSQTAALGRPTRRLR